MTRPSVRFAEIASRVLISVGGIGTILAVTLIFVFLVSVVLPLFLDADIEDARDLGPSALAERPVRLVADENGLLGAVLGADGRLVVHRLDTGRALAERDLFEASPTTWSEGIGADDSAFGFAGGVVRLGRFAASTEFVAPENADPLLAALQPGESVPFGAGLAIADADGTRRVVRLDFELDAPLATTLTGDVKAVDASGDASRRVFVALDADGRLQYYEQRAKRNLLTGRTTTTLAAHELPYEPHPERGAPDHLLLNGGGDVVLLFWDDGRLERLDVRDPSQPALVEVRDVLPDPAARITALRWILGRSTFVVGDSTGCVRAWFRVKPEDADSGDGSVLVAAHELVAPGGAAVTCFAPSQRTRLLATGFADGRVTLHHVTSNQLLGETALPDGRAPELLVLGAKEDSLLSLADGELFAWTVDKRHPEASLAALFAPVWYESYEKPDHVWQSSSGTDDFEPKLGLVPLVFGTIKATFYSMLFGAPIALLAALFTSEFLGRRARTPVKSTIEMMASLPSVVLGFLAGIVLAPFVQAVLPAVLAGLVAIPFCVLVGAYLWQLLPGPVAVRAAGLPRMAAMLLALVVGVLVARALGPPLQELLFAGDVVLWLDGQRGAAWGGWFVLVLPPSALLATLLLGRGLGASFLKRARGWSRRACALADLLRFAVGALLTLGLAFAVAHALDGMGLDARGGMLGTYEQRNALVVGFIMGFAIIPIIYTLADDALTSVPDHLRLASLGAGATPWQTAMRVVVPTAMSGLFSALMIGLGRAVGETMIVLMATGNTPVREWNVFNGFRTLSANIAVELPEAVQGSTHYRTLFLAALVLFGMTFLLNTLAETVRQRFRRRAWQL